MPDEPVQPTEGEPQEPQESTEQQPTEGEQAEDDLTKAKRQANHWQREAKKREKEYAAAQAELEKIREASKTEAEKALDAARKEGRKEAESVWRTKWQGERLQTAALSAMAGRVSDPRLALPHLDLTEDKGLLDDDGNVDEDALSARVEALLDKFPSLAVGSAPTHHGDLGPRRTTARQQQSMNDLLRQAAGRA